MWSSITGCLGPIVGAWACNRYPLPGSANAFGSLRLLFANGVGLRCEEKPSASNSRSWGLKH